MTRVLLCTSFILISLLVSSVNCQENGNGGFWQTFKEAWKEFTDKMKGVWKEFKEEVKARARDMSHWSDEMWKSFKDSMNKWMNERGDISESEEKEMNNFIERLRMAEKEKENER